MRTVAIIGGGASGMAAALTAVQNPQNRVLLLERQARVGRKILSTGNGRCNLSHRHADPTRYHGGDPDFVCPALARFTPEETLRFFRALGLFTVTEPDGKVYPLSNHAPGVVDVLRFALEQSAAALYTGRGVSSIRVKNGGFVLETENGPVNADCVIIACGGAAGTHLGGGMDGYRLLESLGHRKTALYPALVQIKTDPLYPKALKGIKADAAVTVRCEGKNRASSRGEVLFTDYGLSGPAIFDVSRAVGAAAGGVVAELDFAADYTKEEICDDLVRRLESMPHLAGNLLLTGMLQTRLGQMVCKQAGISGGSKVGALTRRDIDAAAKAVKSFVLAVRGTAGFENAQVTAGGIKTADFFAETLQSRLVDGLYACGEVLDIDGDCGGFNLQWAWSSGRLAGRLGE